jgi:hypothetical protein
VAAITVSWVLTIVTLVVLDDLVFGPVFWAIGALRGPAVGFVVAFVVYFVGQLVLVHEATRRSPRRLATFFLRRLGLERPAGRTRPREDEIRARILGSGSAILLSPVVGGVIPPMLLWHRGFDTHFVRRLTIVTAAVYAAEFALLHGWLAGTVAS